MKCRFGCIVTPDGPAVSCEIVLYKSDLPDWSATWRLYLSFVACICAGILIA